MDVLSIVVGFGALLGGAGGVGAVAYFREVRNSRLKKDHDAAVSTRITEALTPVKTDITGLRSEFDHMTMSWPAQLKAALFEALEPVKGQYTELSTKVEPLWLALVQGAIHNAEVLHHPDPERAELDALLDHFKENILTRDEELQLRRFLVKIKNWESGQDLGFPVYESEPSAAANLLSMLDLVRIYRERSR